MAIVGAIFKTCAKAWVLNFPFEFLAISETLSKAWILQYSFRIPARFGASNIELHLLVQPAGDGMSRATTISGHICAMYLFSHFLLCFGLIFQHGH